MRNPPTLGDKLLSNFPRGRGGAMGRGFFQIVSVQSLSAYIKSNVGLVFETFGILVKI